MQPLLCGADVSLKLKSYAIGQTHFAKFSRFCEVVASANDSYECVYEVLTPDPTKRLVSEGVPVMVGLTILASVHVVACGNLQRS